MAFSLLADEEFFKLTELTPEWCREHGIRLLLLDFDNTMIAYTETEPTQELMEWLTKMRTDEISVMVVSNSRKSKRVPAFCDPRGIPWIRHAGKPNPKGILQAMEQQGATPKETAMIGDQTFTDILGGNLAGVTSILVHPIRFSNPFQILRHGIERPFIYLGRKKRKR